VLEMLKKFLGKFVKRYMHMVIFQLRQGLGD
jgi:hypothetical protein